MADLNKVLLIGNLTRDPELRTTPKGNPVGQLSLAVNETYRSQDGTSKEVVVYVDVEVWGRQAETCQQYLKKGRPVFIEGRLRLDQWETAQGEKRRMLKVQADRVQFLGGGQTGTGRSSTEDRPVTTSGSTGNTTRERPPTQGQNRPAPSQSEEMPPLPDDDDIPF